MSLSDSEPRRGTPDPDAPTWRPGPPPRTDTPASELTAHVDIEGRVDTFSPPILPGRIGKYEIVRELGRGGMGVVYLANDPLVGRSVALKMILSAKFADADNWARFVVEAKALAQLQHPHIVRLYDFGTEDGKPFFALEYLEGGSLKERIREQPLSAQAAAGLVQQLAQAIHFAHQKGIIHRDLKPGNVLFDAASDPKIVDFGLAKLSVSGGADTPGPVESLTRTGDVLGSPQYMAPEQAMGVRGIVGAAADVYALGAILYELLTGQPPFDAMDPVQSLVAVMTQDPVAPRRVKATIPRELETICLKCLHKEPRNRYATGAELAADLGRFLSGETIWARSPGIMARGWRWARRNPAIACLVVMVGLVAVVGLAGVSWQWLRAEARAESEAEARRDANRQQAKADRARDEAETALYFSRIHQAQREFEANNVPQAVHLLESCRPAAGATDRRSWEWHYLERLCHGDLKTFKAQGAWAWDGAFSPDGKMVAVALGLPYGDAGRNPGYVTLWDLSIGNLIRVCQGHNGSVQSAVFSPDNRSVVSTSMDGTARLWNVETAKELWQVRCRVFGRSAGPAIFSVNGKEVFVGLNDDTSLRVDMATGKSTEVDGELMGVTAAGDLALYRGKERTCILINAANGRTEGRIPIEGIHPWCISPDGRMAAAVLENSVRLTDGSGQPARTIMLPPGEIYSVCFSPDAAWLATGGADRVVRLWNVATGKLVREYRGNGGAIRGVRFNADGTRLLSADQMGQSKVWDLTHDFGRFRLFQVNAFGEGVGPINFCDVAGEPLLAVENRSTLELWDFRSERRREGHGIPMHHSMLYPRCDRAFSGDGRRFIAPTLKDPTRLQMWDTLSGKEGATLTGHKGGVRTVALNADGSRAATASVGLDRQAKPPRFTQGEGKLWNTVTGQWIADLPAGAYTNLALSADGLLVAGVDTSASDGVLRVRVCEVQTGRELWTQAAHQSVLATLAFSPDGTRLASAGFTDLLVKVWDVATGLEVNYPQPLRGDPSMTSVAFTPDGKRLAAVGYDGNVMFWDPASGNEVLTIRCPAGPRPDDRGFSPHAVFSMDGSWLASNNWGGDISVWDGREWPRQTAAANDAKAAQRCREWHQAQAEEYDAAGRKFAADFHRRHVDTKPTGK